MRLISLQPGPTGPDVPLHTRITVILGLSASERVGLVAAAHCMALGDVPEWEGRAEINGEQMGLGEAVTTMGQSADAALILTASDIAADIPQEIERLRAELDAAVAAAQSNADPQTIKRLDRAHDDLCRAAKEIGQPDPWTGMADFDERVEQITAYLEDTTRRLACLPTGDRGALARSIAEVRMVLGDGDAEDPEKVGLREDRSVLQVRRQIVESRLSARGVDPIAASQRTKTTREAMATAEVAVTPRPISEEEYAEVERLQETYLANHGKATGGVRRGAAKRRMQEAQEQLAAALEPLGYPTWSSLRLGDGKVQVTEETMMLHQQAIIEFRMAEADQVRSREQFDADPERKAIEQLEKEIERALSQVGSQSSANPGDAEQATARLRALLDDSGSTGQMDLQTSRAVLALAGSWLKVLRDAAEARCWLERQHERLSDEIGTAVDSDASRSDDLDTQRNAAHRAESNAFDATQAAFDVAMGRIELHQLLASELTLTERVGDVARTAPYVETEVSGDGTSSTVSEGIPRGVGGPLPIVVLVGDADPSLLDPLLMLPHDIQSLVVGDGDELLGWARSLGSDRCSVVDRGVLV